MPTWKLTLEYDGTRYHGWQEQRNVRTVAGIVRAAAEKLLGNRVELGGAGRTDSGVHALAQVAHLRAGRRLRDSMLARGLNDLLPADINILKAEAVAPNFDARRDAIGRYYLYQISTRRTAFAKQYVWWIKDRLDVDLVRSALESLKGRHNFSAFCEQGPARSHGPSKLIMSKWALTVISYSLELGRRISYGKWCAVWSACLLR